MSINDLPKISQANFQSDTEQNQKQATYKSKNQEKKCDKPNMHRLKLKDYLLLNEITQKSKKNSRKQIHRTKGGVVEELCESNVQKLGSIIEKLIICQKKMKQIKFNQLSNSKKDLITMSSIQTIIHDNIHKSAQLLDTKIGNLISQQFFSQSFQQPSVSQVENKPITSTKLQINNQVDIKKGYSMKCFLKAQN